MFISFICLIKIQKIHRHKLNFRYPIGICPNLRISGELPPRSQRLQSCPATLQWTRHRFPLLRRRHRPDGGRGGDQSSSKRSSKRARMRRRLGKRGVEPLRRPRGILGGLVENRRRRRRRSVLPTMILIG